MKRKRSCRFGNLETLVNRHSSDEQLDRMLQRDAAAAGTPDQDREGRFLDFHSLRHTVQYSLDTRSLVQRCDQPRDHTLTLNLIADDVTLL